jgi:hypothetical protein
VDAAEVVVGLSPIRKLPPGTRPQLCPASRAPASGVDRFRAGGAPPVRASLFALSGEGAQRKLSYFIPAARQHLADVLDRYDLLRSRSTSNGVQADAITRFRFASGTP